MSGHLLLQVVQDALPQESARHQAHPEISRDVWNAQVDVFTSRLATRVSEVLAEELRAALTAEPNTICLHKGLAALDNLVAYLGAVTSALCQGLIALEDGGEADEGGEG